MGMFDWLGTSSSEQSGSTSSTQDIDITNTTNQTQTQDAVKTGSQTTNSQTDASKTGTQTGTQTSTTNMFDADTLALLATLTQSMGGKVGADGAGDLLAAVTGQATATDPAIVAALAARGLNFGENREQIKGDMAAAATQSFDRTTGRETSQNIAQIGSGKEFNSAARLMDSESAQQLAVSLAGLSAQTDMALNEQEGKALLDAVAGSGAAIGNAGNAAKIPLEQLLAVLTTSKGGTQSTTTANATQTAEQLSQTGKEEKSTEEILKAISEILGETHQTGTVKTTGNSSQSGSESSSPLKTIGGIAGAIGAIL